MYTKFLEKGETNWNKLPEQYVIFFTEKDIFKKDLPIYHIESVILEMDKDNRFNDGRHIIYVNCEYLKNPESEGFSKMSEWSESYYNEGLSVGEKKGIQTEKEATILSMYKKNLSIELIAECTRTTVEEVNKIITNNK